MIRKYRIFLIALCLALAMRVSASPAADDAAAAAPWAALKAGGHIVLIRHSQTDPGTGDPAGFALADCATQRNLSASGREHARRLGAAFRQHAIPVTEVLSSRWCRCVDTAELAFGRATRASMLDSMFNDRERPAADKVRAVLQTAARHQGSGNLVMVTHAQNISALSGESVASGEIVVLKPQQGGLKLIGRLLVP